MRAAVAVLLCGCAACPARRVEEQPFQLPTGFEVNLREARYSRADESGWTTQGQTSHLLLSVSTGEMRCQAVDVIHQPAGTEPVQLQAGQGEGNIYSNNLRLQGGVQMQGPADRELHTPSAALDSVGKTLAGPGPATLYGRNYVLHAEDGFVVDLATGDVDLLGVQGEAVPLEGHRGEGPATP